MSVYLERNTPIVNACIAGERSAQYQLYKLYSDAMFNVAFRILKNQNDSEDAIQEAFLDAFLKIKTYNRQVAFGAWLKRIVINKSLSILKKNNRLLFEQDDEVYFNYEYLDDDDFEDESWTIERVKQAMESLPDGYRVVLSLFLFEGYDHSEIGQILNIREASSRSQYLRAKRKLYELLK